PVQTYTGASLPLSLPEDLLGQLRGLSGREGATLFMTLLAAFQAVLGRYCNQEDIVVGSPTANRTRAETEGLIGCFVNILPLRSSLAGTPSFRELVRRVREVALAAYTHQELPFEQLVEQLQVPRDPARSPLFQVAFGLHTLPRLTLPDYGLTVEPLSTPT